MNVAELIQKSIGELAPMPQVAAEVMEKVAAEETTADDLNRVICKDQALASRVLKVANAPFYSRGKPVAGVRAAVVSVGFRTIQSIVVAAALRGVYRSFGKHEQQLWDHAVGCGIAVRQIAGRVKLGNPEQAFLAGLLHDIGKTILLLKLPDKMKPILDEVDLDPIKSSLVLEERAFGFDHAALGQLIARKWNFGAEIEEAIDRHHVPGESPLVRGVCLANGICHVLGIGPGKRQTLDSTTLGAARGLGLEGAELEALIKEVDERISEERAAFAS